MQALQQHGHHVSSDQLLWQDTPNLKLSAIVNTLNLRLLYS